MSGCRNSVLVQAGLGQRPAAPDRRLHISAYLDVLPVAIRRLLGRATIWLLPRIRSSQVLASMLWPAMQIEADGHIIDHYDWLPSIRALVMPFSIRLRSQACPHARWSAGGDHGYDISYEDAPVPAGLIQDCDRDIALIRAGLLSQAMSPGVGSRRIISNGKSANISSRMNLADAAACFCVSTSVWRGTQITIGSNRAW